MAILLCTYNGEEFLSAQLDSIVRQTHENWVIYASDDGSNDATLDILKSYQEQLGCNRLIIQLGPRQGFARNFMSLVLNGNARADFYAFSDQDDVWYPDKLERGIAQLSSLVGSQPALYCSRTHLIDGYGQDVGYSPLFARGPDFANALVQSLAGANTMLLNEPARALLELVPQDAHIVSHDWLCYMVVSGVGGEVIYDPEPTLDYRQHGGNVIGANDDLRARWQRIKMLLGGRFRAWNEQNLYALSRVRSRFTEANKYRLQCFERARESGFLMRLYLLRMSKVYRQTLLGNLGLVVAACLKRI